MLFTFPRLPASSKKGFTLVELLISFGIVGLVTGIALFNHTEFGDSIRLSNLTYTMALQIREAQVSGSSVRQLGLGGSANFSAAYGIHFFTSGGNNRGYIFFADIDNDGRYDGSESESGCASSPECVAYFSLPQGFAVDEFCAETICSTDAGGPTIDELNIIYKRPSPSALIKSHQPALYDYGFITLTSPQGRSRTIRVASTGQVSVQ